MNLQKAEGQDHSPLLDVVSIFKTIQGEGPWSGRVATFVRLAGCTLQCPMCDTLYTIDRTRYSVEEVICQVKQFGVERVVLTGGEPLRQRASTDLLLALNEAGIECQVETSGSVCFGAAWQALPETALPIVVCSPKTGKIAPDLIPFITDYKYVVEANGVDESDGLPIISPLTGKRLRLARPTVTKDHIFISPWDVQDEVQNWKNTQTAVRVCLQHGYRLSLQIHKLVGLP